MSGRILKGKEWINPTVFDYSGQNKEALKEMEEKNRKKCEEDKAC